MSFTNVFRVNHIAIISDNNNNSSEEENIYQPIWKFKTLGEGQNKNYMDGRSCESPVDYELLEDDDGEWEPADDISYHTYRLNLKHSDTIKSKQSTASAPPDVEHTSISHHLNNDLQHESISVKGKYNKNGDIELQYKTICILYSEIIGNNKLRAIIYDYKPFIYLSTHNALNTQNQTRRDNFKFHNAERFEATRCTLTNEKVNHIEAWKHNLYMEDEEDEVRL